MVATKELPADYQSSRNLNLSSSAVVIALNIAALPLLFLFGWIFVSIFERINRTSPFQNGFWALLTSFYGWQLLALILSIIIMLVIHELIHGLFFWFFTRERPRFALKFGYAFAAAPEWFLPRAQYIWVGLSPFILISLASFLLTWIMPSVIIPYLVFIATFNAAGSLGDFLVALWAYMQPGKILIKDEGDIFHSYSSQI